ncbi:retrotransposon protein, putative, ty1-copia subclass [Tanacetum coccineum]
MAIQGVNPESPIRNALNAKGKGKGKGKEKDKSYIPKPKNLKPSAKEHPSKDDACHHCKEVGHCKRNCPVNLLPKSTRQRMTPATTAKRIIFFPTKSWVYDTGCDTHICNTQHGLRGVRKMKQVEAIGSDDLVLPNGLVMFLDNCHYAPTTTRGVVLVSRLVDMHYLDSTYLWHCRLAHISKKRIEKLQHDGFLKSMDDESFDQCVSCLSGEMTRKSFPHRPEWATDLLGLIHTDVFGPLRHVSRQGASYFITFMDDYSCYGYIYLLKHKQEVFEMFKLVELSSSLHLQTRHFERRNRTLLDMVRSMINLTTLPFSFWDYALESAARILNMVPTKKGCEALVKQDTSDKLQQRPVKCIFIGYPKEMMGYYFYLPPENKIVVARYAEFLEKNLISQEVSGRAVELEEIQDEDTSPSEITSEIPMEVEGFEPPQEELILVHRFVWTYRAPECLCLNVEEEEHSLRDFNEPANYKAAMLDPESDKWLNAMNAKMQFMKDNQKKTDMDGIVHTYKACLVAKGHTRHYGVDYEETFSPVAHIRAIRILTDIEAFYDYEIWKVCKLQRSIYGLKQASMSWNKRFDEEIKRFGFAQNLDEPCVYQKASGSNVTFLILYVDDIIIMGNHIPSLQSVKTYLGKCFTMKDLGKAAFIHGIKIYRDRSKRLIGHSQSAYMDKILKRFKMDNSKRGNIPMQEKLDLNKTQSATTPGEVKQMQNVPSALIVGFIINPEAELRVDCYCNAGYETDGDEIKSQTGYASVLNESAVD